MRTKSVVYLGILGSIFLITKLLPVPIIRSFAYLFFCAYLSRHFGNLRGFLIFFIPTLLYSLPTELPFVFEMNHNNAMYVFELSKVPYEPTHISTLSGLLTAWTFFSFFGTSLIAFHSYQRMIRKLKIWDRFTL